MAIQTARWIVSGMEPNLPGTLRLDEPRTPYGKGKAFQIGLDWFLMISFHQYFVETFLDALVGR